ncbi:MAG: adenosylcobinamide-GDP ribazoletransferase [Alphaproteobacteria bacterium]
MPFDSEPEGKFERRIFFSARAWWQDIRSALRFLTRLPLPRAPDPAEPDFFDEVEEGEQETPARRPLGRAVRAFPLIGALLGIAAGFAFAIATGVGLPALVAGVIAVALLALMTGALHEDGLADMADGFGGGQTVEKKLAIMRDSRIGAYGVMALVMVLAAKVGAVADLSDIGVVMSGLICAAAASRAAMPAMMCWLPAARSDGLGAEAGRPSSEHVWTGIIIAVILSVILLTWSGLVALLIAASGTFAVGLLARRQIRGHTGDVLGGAQQISELLFLLTLAAIR